MIETTYAYVVVGGGAAGCVLAARLAAESGKTVALIERGRPDTNRWIHIPATFFKALQSQDAGVTHWIPFSFRYNKDGIVRVEIPSKELEQIQCQDQ